ncbi:MAG: hypothetical protein H7296_13385 [Bacteroidia bacterium]|nr:hypothetical protein [Bacteroidia bacterium]
MKKTLFFLLLLSHQLYSMACPVCERNQPKILKGIVHGSGPENYLDYLALWGMVVLVVFTLFFSVKLLIQPNESTKDHIKNSIFNIE